MLELHSPVGVVASDDDDEDEDGRLLLLRDFLIRVDQSGNTQKHREYFSISAVPKMI